MTRVVTAVVVLAVVAIVAVVAASSQATDGAVVRGFLESHMRPDGRVVRAEGDTVSEGQAYAMLAAVALDDRMAFDQAWEWSKDHLLQPEGHLAWHWVDGRVTDPQPAPDADVDAAAALVLAAQRFSSAGYLDEGRRLAEAVMQDSTVTVGGRRHLTAGPWAVGDPAWINPSYLDTRWFGLLADATGDDRWLEVRESARAVLDALTSGPRLAPDWAVLDAGGVEPSGPPHEPEAEPRWGFDAFRVPIRLASSCDATDRALAARAWALLAPLPTVGVLTTDGAPAGGGPQPVALVGAAASAHAAGRVDEADALFDHARTIAAGDYYADAWLAMSEIFLRTELRDCP